MIQAGDKAVLIKPIDEHGYFRKIGTYVDVISVQHDVSSPSGISVLADIRHTTMLLDTSMLVSEDTWKSIYNTVSEDIGSNLKRL